MMTLKRKLDQIEQIGEIESEFKCWSSTSSPSGEDIAPYSLTKLNEEKEKEKSSEPSKPSEHIAELPA